MSGLKKEPVATLVDLNAEEIEREIRVALEDDVLVSSAQKKNLQVSKMYLAQSIILEQALTFYSI